MSPPPKKARCALAPAVVFASLPGPTRKRTTSAYCYRLTYQSTDLGAPGCVLMWDVLGGRDVYQITLERQDSGRLRWHCTCADAVYRGRPCKHVRGAQALGRRPTAEGPAPAPEQQRDDARRGQAS